MLLRDNKMADVALISTLERNVSFFASSSMLILAGLLTAIASSDKIAAGADAGACLGLTILMACYSLSCCF